MPYSSACSHSQRLARSICRTISSIVTLRAEVVVDHRERHAGVDPGGREEGEVLLVERAPVAAVDEHHAAAVALARREEVDGLARHARRSAGRGGRSWCCARAPKPRPSARSTAGDREPARGCCTAWRGAPCRERSSIPPHHFLSRHSPMASWPGRSEKENSTVSPFASSCSGAQDGTTKVSRGSNSNFSFPMTAVAFVLRRRNRWCRRCSGRAAT